MNLQKINGLLSSFAGISLAEMAEVRLMNRIDTKYIATESQLEMLLPMLQADYRAQETGSMRACPYRTVYFDTPDRSMYLMHHNRRCVRQKIRARKYVGSGLSFVENQDQEQPWPHAEKAHKHRQHRPVHERPERAGVCEPELRICRRGAHAARRKLLQAHHAGQQRQDRARLTIDINLCFVNASNGQRASLDNIVIIELKQDGHAQSASKREMNRLGIRKAGFSKYCIGAALTDSSLKCNLFKKKIRRITKMQLACHATLNQ